ncbi:MAG TPA: carbonic anhydrase [Pirellulales bacterium]
MRANVTESWYDRLAIYPIQSHRGLGDTTLDLIYRYDPYRPIVLRRPADSTAAVRELLEGNGRLVNLVRRMQRAVFDEEPGEKSLVVPIDLLSMGLPFCAGSASDQLPFALVRGCSDARVPIESIFDQTFNDLFVVRIAGNVLATECIGSFDYAVRNLGKSLKAVVVLGHTGCGAVTAAVDAYLSPNAYADIAFSHPLRSLVDRIMIAARGAASALGRRHGEAIKTHPEYRSLLIEAAAYLNAAITAFDLKREVTAFHDNQIDVFYGVCDIGTMLVRACPLEGRIEPELKLAPQDADDLMALTSQLVDVLDNRLAVPPSD